ncbi:MAG: MFS transporter [Candidatus Saccharimonadales bacterium]
MIINKMARIVHLYWVYALFGGAKALVSILGPIYLYRLGFSFHEIILYFIMTAIVKVAALFLVFKLASKFGPRVTMATGILLMVAHFVCFSAVESHGMPLYVVGSLLGLANAFFYPSFRLSFSFVTETKKAGMQVAKLNTISMVFTVASPVVGGVIAGLFGVVAVYYLAAALFFGTFVFLLLRNNGGERYIRQFNLSNIPRGGAVRDYLSNASYSFSGLADLLVWPLFIGLLIPTYAGIGGYAGLLVGMSVIVQLWVGKIADRKGESLFLGAGVTLSLAYNVLRVFISSVGQLIGLSILNALGSSLLASSYGSRFYKNVDTRRRLEYLFMMELANSVTWLLYFPVLLGLSYLLSFDDALRVGIMLIAPAVIGMVFMRSRQRVQRDELAEASI